LPASWNAVRTQNDSVQKHHASLGSQISQNIVAHLSVFKKEHSLAKAQLETDASKLMKEMEKSIANLAKMKTKYHSSAKDAESAQQNSDKPAATPKEQAKVRAFHLNSLICSFLVESKGRDASKDK
jgi:hypothetical protein